MRPPVKTDIDGITGSPLMASYGRMVRINRIASLATWARLPQGAPDLGGRVVDLAFLATLRSAQS